MQSPPSPPKKLHVGLYVPVALKARMLAAARAERRTLSNWAELVMERELDARCVPGPDVAAPAAAREAAA